MALGSWPALPKNINAAAQDAVPAGLWSTRRTPAALRTDANTLSITYFPAPVWCAHAGTWMVVLAALISSTLINCIFPFFTYVTSSGMLGEFLPQVRGAGRDGAFRPVVCTLLSMHGTYISQAVLLILYVVCTLQQLP